MARSLITTDLMSNFIPTTPKTKAHALPADNLNPSSRILTSDRTSDVSLGLLRSPVVIQKLIVTKTATAVQQSSSPAVPEQSLTTTRTPLQALRNSEHLSRAL